MATTCPWGSTPSRRTRLLRVARRWAAPSFRRTLSRHPCHDQEQLRKYTGEWGNLYTDATAEAHLLDVVHQIARTGIRTLILYSGHYPGCQVEMLERIRQQARKDFGIRVVPFCESMIISGDHAGLTETSFLLAVAPELVDMTRIGPENFADHGWSEEKSPLKASRERGEADIALIIEWMRTQLAGEE